jgi:uncharacterized protein YciI
MTAARPTVPGRFAVLLLSACSSTSSAPSDTHVLVLLKTGPRSAELSAEESQRVFAGHFANMKRLAEERRLLVAGPFAAPKRDPDLRGLFILDVPTLAAAEEIAASDPCVQADVMVAECHGLATDAPLEAYIEHELALDAAAKAAGRERPPGEGGRTYVLLTAEDGASAERELAPLAESGAVLLLARLDGERALAVLDAKDVDAALVLLGKRRAHLGEHVLDPWFASGELTRLPGLARAR